MNNMHTFLSRLCHSPIPRCAAVTLVALAWSSLAFCGEIHDAAAAGDLEKIKALLKANPDLVNSKNTNGVTPLMFAADVGDIETVKLLLASNADVNARDDHGITPLLMVVGPDRKNMDMAELLLASNADVNAKDIQGETPLGYAARNGYKNMAELLLAQGANVNAKDNKGETPLRLALDKGHKDVADLLRQHSGSE